MAGGKQTPRQKMINLMYLVFIAMLALNMTKEVLSAFGSINEKLDRANISYVSKNNAALKALSDKAVENAKFKVASETAQAANDLTKAYNDYLALQKELLLSEFEDKTDYETMDQSAFLDALYYEGGEMTEAGQKFITQMDTYRNGMVALLGDTNPTLTNQINVDFSTADVKNRDGQTVNYLEKNYVTFPLVSSLTKMTQIQNDINTVENELLSTLLSGNLGDIASLTNYETVMTTSKGAYYTGSTFDGMLSLGRVDASTKPARVELLLDGKEIKANQFEYDGGRVVLKVGTGSVGDHTISGKLIYLQDGNEVEVLVDKKFTTINKPNAATVKADSMNVVYRGIPNPMTISFAGIEDKDVRVNAIGLSKVKGNKKYSILPQKGRFVTINVSGTLPDNGGTVSDKATFRIKPLPPPVATINDQISADGRFKMPREALEVADIGAKMGKNFNFNLNLKVIGFSVSVPDVPTVKVEGARFNERAKNAIRKAKRGQKVEIFDIKVKAVSNSKVRLDKIPQIVVELAN